MRNMAMLAAIKSVSHPNHLIIIMVIAINQPICWPRHAANNVKDGSSMYEVGLGAKTQLYVVITYILPQAVNIHEEVINWSTFYTHKWHKGTDLRLPKGFENVLVLNFIPS